MGTPAARRRFQTRLANDVHFAGHFEASKATSPFRVHHPGDRPIAGRADSRGGEKTNRSAVVGRRVLLEPALVLGDVLGGWFFAGINPQVGPRLCAIGRNYFRRSLLGVGHCAFPL
jgi:hypothetical protein